MCVKGKKELIKEVADKINNGKEIRLENPTIEDIKALKEFDYITTTGAYFDIMIRRKFEVQNFLGFPIVMWMHADGEDGFEIADTCMGAIPEVFTAEEVYEAMLGFKDESEDISI